MITYGEYASSSANIDVAQSSKVTACSSTTRAIGTLSYDMRPFEGLRSKYEHVSCASHWSERLGLQEVSESYCSCSSGERSVRSTSAGAQRWCKTPLKSSTPTMPKTRRRKPQRTETLPILGMISRMDATSIRISGIVLSARRGRSARTARITEALAMFIGVRMGSQASVTTRKSSWHHGSRRYALRCQSTPYATILTSISKV